MRLFSNEYYDEFYHIRRNLTLNKTELFGDCGFRVDNLRCRSYEIDVAFMGEDWIGVDILTLPDSYQLLEKRLKGFSQIFDFVYIAIPKTYIQNPLTVLDTEEINGIGIISVDDDNCAIIKEAKRNLNIDPINYIQYANYSDIVKVLKDFKIKKLRSMSHYELLRIFINTFKEKSRSDITKLIKPKPYLGLNIIDYNGSCNYTKIF